MTTINSAVCGSDRGLTLNPQRPDLTVVSVSIVKENRRIDVVDLDTADFLAAVAAELDVIVIPRADLPKVVVTDDPDDAGNPDYEVGDDVYTHHYDHRAEALRRLAMAEHLDANPPVDPVDLDTLVDLLGQIQDGAGTRERVALHLLRSGRVTVKEA